MANVFRIKLTANADISQSIGIVVTLHLRLGKFILQTFYYALRIDVDKYILNYYK